MTDENTTPEQTPEQIAAAEAAAEQARAEAEAADRAIRAEDAKRKTDLADSGDAILDDGHSTVPIKQDPTDARKAIYKKVAANRETTINHEAETNADVAQVRDAVAEAAGAESEVELRKRGDDFDTNAPRDNEESRRAAREARVNAGATAAKPEQADNGRVNDVDSGDELVKVKVLGREFEVPKADVEEAGGIKAYQLERSAQERLRNAATREAENKAELQRIADERKALEEQQRAIAEAASKAASSSTQPGDVGTGDVAEEAQKIVDALYSGDRNATRAAVQKILARPGAEKIEAAEIARQAAQLAKAELREQVAPVPAKAEEAQQPLDPEVEELNSYMEEKFPEILTDDTLRNKALARFNELRKLPENAHRRLKDIGRDAGNFAKKSAHPRQEVIERKQTLPPVVTGTQAHSTPAAPAAPTGKSHIERMRQARGLPTS